MRKEWKWEEGKGGGGVAGYEEEEEEEGGSDSLQPMVGQLNGELWGERGNASVLEQWRKKTKTPNTKTQHRDTSLTYPSMLMFQRVSQMDLWIQEMLVLHGFTMT